MVTDKQLKLLSFFLKQKINLDTIIYKNNSYENNDGLKVSSLDNDSLNEIIENIKNDRTYYTTIKPKKKIKSKLELFFIKYYREDWKFTITDRVISIYIPLYLGVAIEHKEILIKSFFEYLLESYQLYYDILINDVFNEWYLLESQDEDDNNDLFNYEE